MRGSGRFVTVFTISLAVSCVLCQESPRQMAPEIRAKRILDATGIRGGLIVHLGCGDGRLTAQLRAGNGYVVHGLDCDVEDVRRARGHIEALGCYGPVSVGHLRGRQLPYVDNLVNLIVAEDSMGIPRVEMIRVLAPRGVAYIKDEGKWTKVIKPWPGDIDEWTHFLHDASNNAVAEDMRVGPPHQLQWVAGPDYARSHDHLASVSVVVSSAGRVFYVVDEGPTAAVVVKPQWSLVARDAFNGILLWKRPIPNWEWHLRGFRSGPSDLSRRLVSAGDRVYVTLGIDAPVSVLDGATGRTVTTYGTTAGALEILHADGKLFVVTGRQETEKARGGSRSQRETSGLIEVRSQRPAYREDPPLKRIVAIKAASGDVLWTKCDADTAELMPTTLAFGKGRVFFQNPEGVLCLDAERGEEVWRAERPVSRIRPTWTAPTLVVYGDVVLSADRAGAPGESSDEDQRKVEWIVSSRGGQAPVGELIAFSAEDGKRLWSCPCRECYNAPVDVLVADGIVWTGDLVRAKDPGVTEGRDPRTGKVKRTRPKDQNFFAAGMGHGRCYRNKATSRYLVLGRSGIEFVDVRTGKVIPNHWTRGTCQYGVMPCNGLLYVPPHSCACFTTAKLAGFNCFSSRSASATTEGESSIGPGASRLEKGPAFEDSFGAGPIARAANDWPTYRHDPARTGCTKSAVRSKLERFWRAELGGKLSSVVAAGDKVYVAAVDAHTVHALDARTGRPCWQYTAGGRVDSPPTVWQGRVLFGCADGYVYCLRASDGVLAWRLRVAPNEKRIMSHGHLESLWPVDGSVLVRDGVVYCAAGRSSYLNGGIRLCRLDAKTGSLISETCMEDRDPQTGYQRKGVVRGTNMPGSLPDILSCDGDSVYMRHKRFDLGGQPQPSDVPHLFSPAGYLDGSWWHRTYWLVGTMVGTNYGGWPRVGNQVPAGRLLVVDESTVYGFGRNQYIHHGAHVGIDGATIFHFRPDQDGQRRFTYYQVFSMAHKASQTARSAGREGGRRNAPSERYRWTQNIPFWARAMVLAGKTLVLAGPPDILESDSPTDALEGRQGGVLWVLDASDGAKRAEYTLQAPPVFDGMAAAGDRLYMACSDGSVLCMQ